MGGACLSPKRCCAGMDANGILLAASMSASAAINKTAAYKKPPVFYMSNMGEGVVDV